MITRLTVRCWHCDVERVYPIPGDFSDVIIEMEIYHSVCGRKMDYWTEEVELRHRKGEPDKRNPRVVIEIEEVATGERQTAP